ncbi:MAG TPA: ornithine cyclodeaminase family protein [Hyphomicrobiales bacterium]|nr:ornithine cyclodeaminase family protein [Hyphomicrobiales bacterium]
MLFIHNDVVEQVLTMADCIDSLEHAFRQITSGGAIHRPRIDMYVPCEREDGYYRWGTMEGANDGIFAIRMKSDVMTWPRDAEGNWRENKYCVQPGTFCGLIMLFSTQNGEPLAIINDGVLQHLRVGAGAGVGAKHLARKDAQTVGMLGSGGMARTFLEAFTVVRDIRSAKVYSPTRENREAYAEEMSAKLGIEITPVDTAREAVRGVDILSTCTDSMAPTFEADWLEPGMHVVMLGPAEISQAALARFDVKVRQGTGGLNLPESERVKSEIGHSPVAFVAGTEEEMKRLPPKTKSLGFGGDFPDYCDLVEGRCAGRETDEQISFYHNMGNQGLQFSAAGGLVYRKAKEQGLGTVLPTEWFLQDIRD